MCVKGKYAVEKIMLFPRLHLMGLYCFKKQKRRNAVTVHVYNKKLSEITKNNTQSLGV